MSHKKRPFKTPPGGKRWGALKPLARKHRHTPTPAEDRLWQHVRRSQLGVPIRRQHAIDRFIVDFYCPAARLVIEIDGAIHAQPNNDVARQQNLEDLGLRVLRFTNAQVLEDLETVLAQIRAALED